MDNNVALALVKLMAAFERNLEIQSALMQRSSILVDQQVDANNAVLPILVKTAEIFEKAEPLIDGFIDMALTQGAAELEKVINDPDEDEDRADECQNCFVTVKSGTEFCSAQCRVEFIEENA